MSAGADRSGASSRAATEGAISALSTPVPPQTAQATCPAARIRSKSSAERNQPSKSCPSAQLSV